MTPDLPEKLLGIDVDESEQRSDNQDEVVLERFVYVSIGDHRFAIHVDDVRAITDVPDSLTTVPRSPEPIEGVVDIRGEITAVVDPHPHFPSAEPVRSTESVRLVVFDRPNDSQQAAIRVDDIRGVESVPESNVRDDPTEIDHEGLSEAIEHPLVIGIVEVEQTVRSGPFSGQDRPQRPGTRSGDEASESANGGGTSLARSSRATDSNSTESGSGRSLIERSRGQDESGDEFGVEFDPDDADDEQPEDDGPDEILVEATAQLDVDRFLLASGRRE